MSNSDVTTKIFFVKACSRLLTAREAKVPPLWLAMMTMVSLSIHEVCQEKFNYSCKPVKLLYCRDTFEKCELHCPFSVNFLQSE